MDAIGADGSATLALAAKQGYAFSTATVVNLLVPVKAVPMVFTLTSKKYKLVLSPLVMELKKGVVIPQMGLVYIAPLISKLLNLNMPAGDGVLLEGLLK
jgi:hypothetical protein